MKAIYYLLIVACGACAITITALTLTLIYSTQPVAFQWAVTSAQAKQNLINTTVIDKDIQGECEPIKLDQPPISYRTIAEFATEAVIAVNTFDFLDWDIQLPPALNRYFTPRAARIYLNQFRRSGLLKSIQNNYYTVNTLPLRPAIVVSATKLEGSREWKVQVPVRLYYRTGANTVDGTITDEKRDQVFTVRVVELAPTSDNYRGVGVQQISNTIIREVSDLDKMR